MCSSITRRSRAAGLKAAPRLLLGLACCAFGLWGGFGGIAHAAGLAAAAKAGLRQPARPTSAAPLGSAQQGDGQELQARARGDALIPTCRFERARCGYIDRDGKTVIAPQFDWVKRFAAGRALVGKGCKYGVIDERGKLAVPFIYDWISPFDRSLALVAAGNLLGVINPDGQQVVPVKHGAIVRIADQAFLVRQPPFVRGRDTLIYLRDARGTLDWLSLREIPPAHDATDKRWGIVASGGAWIARPKFVKVKIFSKDLDGLFWAADSTSPQARWQLMRADGSPVNGLWFDEVEQIGDGEDRAVVARGERWGALNKKGEFVVEPKFERLRPFCNGSATYEHAEREGRIDRNGNILSDHAIQPIVFGSGDNAWIPSGASADGVRLYTDKAGAKLLNTENPRCPDGRHLALDKGQWKIMTADERSSPDIAFQWVSLECAAPSLVEHDGKWGFVTTDGRLLAGRYFDSANGFHDGIAMVRDDGLWSVIDENGNALLGPLKLASDTGITTCGGSENYSIDFGDGDTKLDKALALELARDPDALTRPLTPPTRTSEGLTESLGEKTGKWGFLDASGRFVIPPRFEAVGSFKRGLAWVAFPERRQWCQIDKTGRIHRQTPCRCNQPFGSVEPQPEGDCYDAGIKAAQSLLLY